MTTLELYNQLIMDEARQPKNYGRLKDPTHQATVDNLLCGDSITVQLIVLNQTVEEIKFTADSCLISIAYISILSERVRGKDVEKIMAMKPDAWLETVNLPLDESREQCAQLGLQAIKKALELT